MLFTRALRGHPQALGCASWQNLPACPAMTDSWNATKELEGREGREGRIPACCRWTRGALRSQVA